MRIVVTGANGYIGSHLTKTLLDMNCSVVAVDITTNLIDTRAEIRKDNIYDKGKNFYEEWQNPDVVIHLACKDVPVHNSLWHINSISDNFYFIKNLIDNGCKHIITIGSMHDVRYYEGAVSENVPPNPRTFYGISKDTLRRLIEVYISDKEVTYQHLRFFYTYGDDEQSSGSIFSKILQMEKQGQTTFPFTDGQNEFDYIHINELTKQIAAVAFQTEISGIINCCSGKPIKIKDKVESFIKENNLKIKPAYGQFPSRQYDSPCIYGDNKKITEILKTSNKVNL